MNYRNTFEIYWDTYIDKIFGAIEPLMKQHLQTKHYGEEVENLDTIVLCAPLNYNRRKTFSRKEKFLYCDIIIDYNYYMSLADENKKKECIALYFLHDLQELSKFKPKGFVLADLIQDLKNLFENVGWLENKSTIGQS